MLANDFSGDRAPIPFHVLSKAIGSSCNLACRYCYYPQESHPTGKMDEVLLEQFIREYITSHPSYSKAINFVWQGGEPTLAGISFYKKVLKLQKKYAPKDVQISNSIQTNGTLITEEWARFFKDHDFIVGLSLDGDLALNDEHRIDKYGHGSHTKILQGLRNLQKYSVEFNVLVVVHNDMIDQARELYRYFVSIGVCYLQFQPLTSSGRADGKYQLSAKNWGRFLSNIYQEWKQAKHLGKVFILNIENSYAQYFTGFSPTCVHSKVCGNQLALETDGSVYACDHLIDEKHYLGNIQKGHNLTVMLKKSIEMSFGMNKAKRSECQKCEVKMLCEGGCPTHITSDGKNSLCKGYYQFFNEILKEVGKFSRDREGITAWQKSLGQ